MPGQQLAATCRRPWRLLVFIFICLAEGEDVAWCAPLPGRSHGNQVLLAERESPSPILLPAGSSHDAGDWDADGDVDILVGDAAGIIRYFENVGSVLTERVGQENPFHSVQVPGHSAPRLVDWDGDGDMDLLVGSQDGKVRFYEQLDLHSLRDRGPVYSNLSEHFGFSAVDWDRDGDVDLIACGERPKIRFFERVQAGLVELTGSANPFQGFEAQVQNEPCHIYAADWDGDGDADFMYVGENLRYFARTERGTLIQRQQHMNPFYDLQRKDVDLQSVSFVDWNGDGDLDIIAGPVRSDSSLRFFARERVQQVVEAEWAGPNGLAEPSNVTSHYVPCAVDWDGDGDIDLLVGCSNGTVSYYKRTPEGLVHQIGSANPFDGIRVDLVAVPRAVDWDGDGDLDLLLAGYHGTLGKDYDGSVRYFERTDAGSLVERVGAQNPFRNFVPDGEMVVVPTAVDWDSDGDVDFLVAGALGQIRYFERVEDGSLQERLGDQNPLESLDVGPHAAVEITDWNGDGTLDVLVGTGHGRVRFFKQLKNQSFTELTGASNPLARVRTRFSVMPYAVDWDDDGDTDLLAGVYTGGFSGVLVFNRGYCNWRDLCFSRGFTKGQLDTCSCIHRYDLKDCSGCDQNYFSGPTDATLARECLSCPGVAQGMVCNGRGYCHDDAAALRQFPHRNRLQLSTVTGNGTCTCQEPFWGEGCEHGECPAGHEYGQEDLFTCHPCFPGWFKAEAGNSEKCRVCEMGRFSSHWGSASCFPCRSPRFRSRVDLARSSCDFNTINIPVAVGVLLFSVLLILPLPWMFCHRVPLADVRWQPGGVTVSTTGKHWLLPNRLARVTFQGTAVPWLDEESYAVKSVSERQLLLCDQHGSAISTSTDTSQGALSFHRCHSACMVGLFGLPFLCWLQLFGGTLAGILYMTNVWQESDGFYATHLEILMMAVGVLCALGANCWRSRTLLKTDLQRDLRVFSRQLQELHLNPRAQCPRGQLRAITAGQLWDFFMFWQSYICNRNMYYVVSNIVKPLTRPRRVSYAELAGSSSLQWFVSHYWGTPFCHFVSTVRKHAETLSDPSPVSWMLASYWVCSFANNQWCVEEEVGMSWDQSSFYLALHSGTCQGTVMVFDNEALPLTRSWCLFELLQTAVLSRGDSSFLGLQICTPSGVMNHGQTNIELAVVISKKLADLNLRDAQASCQEDKHMIDRLVAEQPGGFEQVNAYLTQAVNAALQATAFRFQEDLQQLHHRLASRSGAFHAELKGTANPQASDSRARTFPGLLGRHPPIAEPRCQLKRPPGLCPGRGATPSQEGLLKL